MSSSVFSHNGAAYFGGAVSSYSSKMHFNQTRFTANRVREVGAAVSAYTYSDLEFLNVEFSDNWQAGSDSCAYDCGGGAIYAADFAVLAVLGGRLRNNSASRGSGGAILARDSAVVEVQGVLADSNLATEFGGGIAAKDSSSVLLEALVVLQQNTAGAGGGAIFSGGGTVTLDGVSILGNKAAGLGGGILMYSAVQVTSDVLIADNEAGNGGGLF